MNTQLREGNQKIHVQPFLIDYDIRLAIRISQTLKTMNAHHTPLRSTESDRDRKLDS